MSLPQKDSISGVYTEQHQGRWQPDHKVVNTGATARRHRRLSSGIRPFRRHQVDAHKTLAY